MRSRIICIFLSPKNRGKLGMCKLRRELHATFSNYTIPSLYTPSDKKCRTKHNDNPYYAENSLVFPRKVDCANHFVMLSQCQCYLRQLAACQLSFPFLPVVRLWCISPMLDLFVVLLLVHTCCTIKLLVYLPEHVLLC